MVLLGGGGGTALVAAPGGPTAGAGMFRIELLLISADATELLSIVELLVCIFSSIVSFSTEARPLSLWVGGGGNDDKSTLFIGIRFCNAPLAELVEVIAVWLTSGGIDGIGLYALA